MNNLPGGSELLKIARETLVKEILPGAVGDARYTILMIANAMAIAARASVTESIAAEINGMFRSSVRVSRVRTSTCAGSTSL